MGLITSKGFAWVARLGFKFLGCRVLLRDGRFCRFGMESLRGVSASIEVLALEMQGMLLIMKYVMFARLELGDD